MGEVLSLMAKLRAKQHEERRLEAVINQMRFEESVAKQKGKWVYIGRGCIPCHADGSEMTRQEFEALPDDVKKSFYAALEEEPPAPPKPPLVLR